jgi:two-component system sensor histidine kinase PilS (NtrC family)
MTAMAKSFLVRKGAMSNNELLHTSLKLSSYNPYDLLRIYTYYRTLLGAVLLLMFQLEFAAKVLGSNNPTLFFYTSAFYTGFNFLSLVLMWRLRFQPSARNLFSSLLVDVIALSLLMHASGGAQSGLGYLLLIAIAAGGIMLRERIATFLAAITTIAVISEGAYRFFVLSQNNQSLFSSATLSTLAFFTSLLFQYLSRKIRLSYQEAQEQAAHAAHLQKLAQLIIERMRTGIIVLDKNQEFELINESATHLLGIDDAPEPPRKLTDIPELQDRFSAWKRQLKDPSFFTKQLANSTSEIKASFAHLEPGNLAETLIFLEDVRALNQQAQQLKLASLGRLTASIAHEIRNPLGAISHASQLLGESTELNAGDERLLSIIDSHSKRVNQIIENILQLSRRRPSNPQQLDLSQWIPTFITDYKITKGHSKKLSIEFIDKMPTVFRALDADQQTRMHAKFDPSQLQQVLTNLSDNGIRYGIPKAGRGDLRIEIGNDTQHQQSYIRVIDYGPGITAENSKHLFEPFFTTENTGSGLGLYICKELCEANQALISYRRTDQGESCFHIQLAHPDKAL